MDYFLKPQMIHIHIWNVSENLSVSNICTKKIKGPELSSYEIELLYRVTQNDVTLRVTNSKCFIESLLLSYKLDFIKY